MQSTEENVSESCYERDLSEEFFKARISYKQELTGEITLVMDRLNRLAIQAYSNAKNDSFFESLTSSVSSLFARNTDKACLTCPICNEPFSLFKRRTYCQLCNKTICTDCGDFVLQLPDVGGTHVQGTADCCKTCCDLALRGENYKTWAKKSKSSVEHPFFKAYQIIKELERSITRRLKNMEDALNEATDKTSYELQVSLQNIVEAEMHNRLLSQNFVTLHSLMKEMEEFEPRKETDIQFRKALKAYVASFVQKNSASLSALQKRMKTLREISPEGTKKEEQKSSATAKTESQLRLQHPELVSVEPTSVPLEGATITIYGENFKQGISVFIGSKKCKATLSNDGKSISVKAPSNAQGFALLELVNPDGAKSDYDKIILYTKIKESDSSATTQMRKTVSSIKKALFHDKKQQQQDEEMKEEKPIQKIEFKRSDRKQTTPISAGTELEPKISSVEPAVVSSNGGTSVTISGEHFTPSGVTVFVDNERIESCVVDSQGTQITFETPKVAQEGHKSVKVINSNGKEAVLENILFFMSL